MLGGVKIIVTRLLNCVLKVDWYRSNYSLAQTGQKIITVFHMIVSEIVKIQNNFELFSPYLDYGTCNETPP